MSYTKEELEMAQKGYVYMDKPTTIEDALAYWESGDGRPYRGSLIDKRAYEENPENLGCMCAQGQVLVLSGRRSIEELLASFNQEQADKEVAEVWNISRAHSILLRQINDKIEGAPSVVITNPGKVLGDKWSHILDFWWMLDGFSAEQWAAAGVAARAAAMAASWDAAMAASWDAAGAATEVAARAAARDVAMAASWDAAGAGSWAGSWAASGAAAEIQGFDLLEKHSFLNAFGISSLEDIPPRPDDYGRGRVPVIARIGGM